MARCIALLLGSSGCWALGNLEKWGEEEKAAKTRKYGTAVAVVGFVLWMVEIAEVDGRRRRTALFGGLAHTVVLGSRIAVWARPERGRIREEEFHSKKEREEE